MRLPSLLLAAPLLLPSLAAHSQIHPKAITPADVVAGTINACVAKTNGATRIVPNNASCATTEVFVQWNVQGLTGPRGATGLTGLTGPAGPRGLTGMEGPAGPAGSKGAAGIAGVAGPSGPTGPAGPQGPIGPAGAPGTGAIPANLTALSNNLATYGPFLGTDSFSYDTALCQIGDVVLSVNGYGLGALPADGRILPISSYTAIFSLIGINYGGNGTSNFALPDLRANAPKGFQYSICVNGIFPSHL